MSELTYNVVFLLLIVGELIFCIWIIEEIIFMIIELYNYFTGIRYFYKWALRNEYHENKKIDYDNMLLIGREFRSKLKIEKYNKKQETKLKGK